MLLTGAGGFIGSAVAAALEATGHDVIAVDAYIPQAHPPGTATGPGVRRLDVRDAGQWVHLLRGVDVVCHQSAMVGAGGTVADLPLYAGHNDLATAALMAAMHQAGVRRLVQASSMVVYGEGRYACPRHGERAPGTRSVSQLEAGRFEHGCPRCDAALEWRTVSEDARLDPRSSYAASKVAQEHYAAAWARQSPGSAISLRYHNVYGAGMPRDTPYSGVAAFFRSAIEAGRSPEVFEDGAQVRDFVHVSDAARANVAAVAAVSEQALGEHAAYNICSGTPVTVLDVATFVAEGTGTELRPVVSGAFRLGDVRHVVASPARARADLGFSARVTPEEGLRQFAHEPLRG